ncbi:MAG: thymidylate synthase [Oscillospiraceae bacterium]|nr:thymidylate synthase [Oscillospiraceae bacterium]
MKEVFVTGHTLPEAYHKAIMALYEEGDVLSCNDWNQKQKEVSMTFVVENPLAEPMITKLYIGGFRELQQYVMEVLDGILDFKIGDGLCWEYTYHDRLVNYDGFNQVEFIINELKRNNDSRRAVAIIRDNKVDPFNTDPACLQHMQFFIRDGKLHCKVLMRSNDAVEASYMNAFAFIMLQKSIADRLGVEMGNYTHRANSYHCYEKDFNLLEQYVKGIKNNPIEDITYCYEGDYQELMEESLPEINNLVQTLKDEMKERL